MWRRLAQQQRGKLQTSFKSFSDAIAESGQLVYWAGHSHKVIASPVSLNPLAVSSRDKRAWTNHGKRGIQFYRSLCAQRTVAIGINSGTRGHWFSSGGLEKYNPSMWKDCVDQWARAIHQQALASSYLWPASSSWRIPGVFWPAERWLLVSSLFRNSSSYVPDFGQCLMRGRWTSVAAMTSLNTVGVHVPRMLALLLAQCVRSMRSADALSRDTFYPWKDVRKLSDIKPQNMIQAKVAQAMRIASNVTRLIWLILVFSPLVLTSPIVFSLGWFHSWWMQRLRITLEICGPAFIKWGQWAATRKEMFPPQLCNELEKLQTKAPEHSFAKSKQAIVTAFGISLEKLFDEFDEHPIASGSIGQVHRAVLGLAGSAITGVPVGTQVAVKVRHPGVDTMFHRDHQLMLGLSKCLNNFPVFKNLKLEDTLKQFAGPLVEQVDLCIEAANLCCFNHNFRHDDYVTFPEPLFPLVTQDILVETFHKGMTVTDICELEAETESGHMLADLGTSTFFKMLISHNLMHGDLHPGNILVEFAPKKTFLHKMLCATSEDGQGGDLQNLLKKLYLKLNRNPELVPRIVLLDAGMATQLTKEEQLCMVNMFRGLSKFDGEAVAKAALSFAGEDQVCPNPQEFENDMIKHFEGLGSTGSWEDSIYQSPADALNHCLEMIRRHHVFLPGEVCSALFTVLVLEGWSSKLDQEHGVMEKIQHMITKWDKPWGKPLLGSM